MCSCRCEWLIDFRADEEAGEEKEKDVEEKMETDGEKSGDESNKSNSDKGTFFFSFLWKIKIGRTKFIIIVVLEIIY